MTMQEVNAKIVKEFQDEIQSAVSYHQMALTVKSEGREVESFYLFKIAQDEMSHAKWIYDYSKENSLQLPADQLQKYKELESAHKF